MDTQKVMSAEKPNIIELIKNLNTFPEAVALAIRLAKPRIKKQKQIYLELGIEKGKWSRILSGSSDFPNDLIPHFCDIVGNDIVIHYLAYQRGYELRIIPKVLEDEIEGLKEENKNLKSQVEILNMALEKLGSAIKITMKKQEKMEK